MIHALRVAEAPETPAEQMFQFRRLTYLRIRKMIKETDAGNNKKIIKTYKLSHHCNLLT